jgi:hypothetical protein
VPGYAQFSLKINSNCTLNKQPAAALVKAEEFDISKEDATPSNTLKIKIDTVSASHGALVKLTVRVWNFKSILSALGTITFDQNIITYDSVNQFGLPSLNASNFGTTQTSSGKFIFAWIDPSLSGATVADSTVIFALNFSVVGVSGQKSLVQFADTPADLEFVDTNYTALPIDSIDGYVNVSGSLGIPQISEATDFILYPNPNEGDMQLDYELNSSDMGKIIIYDAAGRIVYCHNLENYKNTLQINAAFLNRGIYFCQVIEDERTVFADKIVITR